MSKSLNRVTLIGNVGADPEIRTTNTGIKVATVSLATSQSWKDARGEQQEKTQWHRLICWSNAKGPQLAEVVEEYVKKGDRLYIEGQIEYRTWQDKEGQTRYATEINVRDLILLGGRAVDGDGQSGGWSGSRANAPQAATTAAKKTGSFEDFPEALEAEDDDLGF